MTDPTPETVDGRLLAVRREELQLAIADVADRLLLSRAQVRALESGEVRAFYNQAFYNQAQRRYAELLGIVAGSTLPEAGQDQPAAEPLMTGEAARQAPVADAALSDVAPMPPAEDLEPTPPVAGAQSGARSTGPRSAGSLTTLLVLGVLVAGIYSITHMEQLRATVNRFLAGSPAPSQTPAPAAESGSAGSGQDPDPVPTPPDPTPPMAESGPPAPVSPSGSAPSAAVPGAPAPADARTATADTPPGPPRSTAAYQIEAQGLCWVFARDANGKETEITLRQGERTSFPDGLTFLAIGDINAIRLRIDGVERDLASLSKDGRVVRLRQAELERLRSGSTLR